LKVVGGAGIVVGIVVATLAVLGVLTDAYRQSLVSVIDFLSESSTNRGGQPLRIVTKGFNRLSESIKIYLRDDRLLLLIMPVGIVYALVKDGLRRALADPVVTAPLFAGGLLLGAFVLDSSGEPDLIMIVPLFSMFAALAVSAAAVRLMERVPALSNASVRVWIDGAALLGLLIYGLLEGGYRYNPAELSSVFVQEQRALALVDALEPGETVQVSDSPWFLVLTGRANASSILWFGPKIETAYRAAGYTMEEIVAKMEDPQPSVVMISRVHEREPLVAQWLDENFIYMGRVDAQWIFVRHGHEHLVQVIEQWPRLTDRDGVR
jgi:hypothetical protein